MAERRSPDAASRRARQRAAADDRRERLLAQRRRDRRARMLRRAAAGLAAAAVIALLGVGLARAGRSDPGARVAYNPSTRVVDFQLPAFGGGSVSSTQLRGRPAVVNFYASWCTVCNDELPAFQAVHQRAGDRLRFLGVNPQSNDDDNSQAVMIRRTGVRYPTVRDRNDALLRLFNTTGALPTTLFLDVQGRVVHAYNGGFDEQSLTAAIGQYLGVTV